MLFDDTLEVQLFAFIDVSLILIMEESTHDNLSTQFPSRLRLPPITN